MQTSNTSPSSPAVVLRPGQVLRMPETISHTGLGRSTIYDLIKAGDFAPVVHLSPRRIGFRVSDLDAWIAGRVQQ